MPESRDSRIPDILENERGRLLERWLDAYTPLTSEHAASLTAEVLEDEGRSFITTLAQCLRDGDTSDLDDASWQPLHQLLLRVARRRLRAGVPMREAGLFVSTFKEPLIELLSDVIGADNDDLASELQTATRVLDMLTLKAAGVYLAHRESIIERQRQELIELSTPVVKVWDGILALPLIGTLDSARTQVVMESLLDAIAEQSAEIAILDITGVPTVDSEVAQNLMKTVSAARLMGASCIISGVRPQIAQTIVQLGLHLESIESRTTMADAIALAFRRTGRRVVSGGEPG